MDRNTVFPGAIPLDTDFLTMQRSVMTGIGYLAQAVIGTGTVCDGLACLPTSPASLTVTVGPGSMLSMGVVDANAWGSLGADTTDPLMKMGINTASNSFTFVAPTTSGYSQIFLIQGQMQEADTTPVLLAYFNAANPAMPYSGAANNGLAQNTQRTQRVVMSVKPGTPAPSGTQTTPAPDTGYSPLWLITIANGTTALTSANIQQADGAPFILNKLSMLRKVLLGATTFYISPYGSDSNSGLGPTPSSAWQTLQGAWTNLLAGYDTAGQQVTLSLAGSATYAAAILTGSPVGQSYNSIIIQGAGNTTILGSVGSTTALTVGAGAAVTVKNLAYQGGFGLAVVAGGVLTTGGGLTSLVCASSHYYASGGILNLGGGETISGAAPVHYSFDKGGQIILSAGSAPTINHSTALAYSTAFIAGASGGCILWNGTVSFPSFTGTAATGLHYTLVLGAVLDTSGAGGSAGANLPGGTAGTGAGTTGWYR